MVTLWDVKTKIWAEMVQKSTSTTYTSEKLTNMVNEVGENIIDKQVYNELTDRYVQISALPFNEWVAWINIIDNPTLTADVSVWDTEINCDTSDMQSSWAIMLWWDIIKYTGKTATTITWVTGILLEHKSWEEVVVLYDTPSDFLKPLKFYKVENQEEKEVKGKREWDSLVIYYNTIYFWDDIYIITSTNISWNYYLRYTKSYTVMTNDSEDMQFPDDISLNAIVYIAAWRLIKDVELRQQLLTKWYGNLTIVSNKYSNQSWLTKKPRWKRFWFSSIKN